MGPFEFVIAIVALSFIFKIVKLHYESKQGDGDPDVRVKHPALNKGGHRAEAKLAPQVAAANSASQSRIWPFVLVLAGISVAFGVFSLVMFSYLSLQRKTTVHNNAEWNQSGILEEMPEASQSVAAEFAPVPPSGKNATKIAEFKDPAQPILQQDDAPDDFLADKYPGIGECGAPMAIKVYEELSPLLEPQPNTEAEESSQEEEGKSKKAAKKKASKPLVFWVFNDELSEQDFLPFLVAFRTKMQEKIEHCVVKDASNLARGQNSFTGMVKINTSTIPNSDGRENRSMGRLVCKARYENLQTTVISNYVEKRWLTDMEGFAGNLRDNFIVGRSDHFFASEAQAIKQALKNGSEKVPTTPTGRHGVAYKQVDRLVQKYERPYGDVFRCAVLLEGGDPKNGSNTVDRAVAGSVSSVHDFAQNMRVAQPPSFEWFIALLIGLTVMVGAVSNMLTQGYYRTEITTSVKVMLCVGFVLLLLTVVTIVA